jgi:hypothetical protein
MALVLNKAFFDGAGKETGPVLTVGGYFAGDKVCEAIEKDWLDATGGRVFHLADFGTVDCELGSVGWSNDEKVEFLKKLGKIINREGVYIISVSLEVSEYAAFLKVAQYKEIFGPAYSALAQLCTHTTERTLYTENRAMEKVAYTFEKGERQHEVSKAISDYEERNHDVADYRTLSFLPKKTPLLQPADLIAGTVQHVLLGAYSALRCLDNGHLFTRVDNFEHHYSKNGVTAAVIPPYNGRLLRYVVNKPLFANFDLITAHLEERKPEAVHKHMKQFRNQGKRKKSA